MPADPNRVRDVFLAAVELSPEQRPGYLAEACGGDADLRAEVDRLLVANADPDSILEPASPTTADATGAFVPSHPGTVELPGGTSATAAFDPDAPSPHGDRDRGVTGPTGRRRRSPTPIPMPPRRGNRRPPRPARPGSRRAKGSAPSSPAGTRWSR